MLRRVPNTSNIKTGFDALVKNEFTGLKLEKDNLVSVRAALAATFALPVCPVRRVRITLLACSRAQRRWTC